VAAWIARRMCVDRILDLCTFGVAHRGRASRYASESSATSRRRGFTDPLRIRTSTVSHLRISPPGFLGVSRRPTSGQRASVPRSFLLPCRWSRTRALPPRVCRSIRTVALSAPVALVAFPVSRPTRSFVNSPRPTVPGRVSEWLPSGGSTFRPSSAGFLGANA